MTVKQRLVSDREIERVFAVLKKHGVDVRERSIDIRGDGVTVYPPAESLAGGNAYDRWKAKDASRD